MIEPIVGLVGLIVLVGLGFSIMRSVGGGR